MADRIVKVSLIAQVNNYVAGMEQARKKTEEVTKSTEDSARKFEEQNRALSTVGAGVTAFGAIAAAAVTLAVVKFAEFDKAISQVQAATHASTVEMDALREAALQAGADTAFTATEAANAIEEMAKAGISTADILGGGLKGALDLAAAGGLGVADAAGISSVALKQFQLRGQDVTHVADLLAAGAGKAMGDVSDLSMALRQSGLVAQQTGLSIEETTAALSAFASAGLLGSDAGTSFKSMLQRLTPQSTEAANLMKQLGISAYDAQGNFIGLQKFAGNLQTSLKGLTAEQRNSALATIFGTDAVRAAAVLYNEGAAGIAKWTANVNDQGYAAETAAIRMNNLAGDIEKLGGAFDTALIKTGEAANGVLRGLVQTATQLVDGYGQMPPILQQLTLALGVAAAGAGLFGGAFLLAVPKIAEFRLALAVLAESSIPAVATAATGTQAAISGLATGAGRFAAFLTGPWGIALVAAAAGVTLLADAIDNAEASTQEIENTLKTATTAAQIFRTAGQGKELGWWTDVTAQLGDLQKVLDSAQARSESFFNLFDSTYFGSFDALKEIGTQLGAIAANDLPAAQHAFSLLAAETDGSQESLMQLLNLMPDYKKALIDQATSQGIAANDTNLLRLAQEDAAGKTASAAQQYLDAANSASDYSSKLRDLIDTINEYNGVGQTALSANVEYQDQLAKVNEQIQKIQAGTEGYSATLDINTQAGRDNVSALNDLAAKSQDAAKAQFDLDGNTEKYRSTLEQGRQALINSALQMGATEEQARQLADQIYKMPTDREIKILADTAAAKSSIDEFVTTNSGRTIKMTVRADGQVFIQGAGGKALAWANGGLVDYYADGALRESHVAQIAPAGAYRVWAEPETGGEAYIPLSPAKRGRSIDIWAETGKRLGVYGFANGAVLPPIYATSSMSSSPVVVASGDTFQASFNVTAAPNQSLSEQVFTAARRLKVRTQGRR